MSLAFVSNPARARIEQAGVRFQADRARREREAELAVGNARQDRAFARKLAEHQWAPETHQVAADLASNLLKQAETAENKAPQVLVAVPWRVILNEVAEAHGLNASDLTGPSRFSPFVAARQEAMYRMRFEVLGRDGKPMSFPQIGRRMGGRDHTTVIHSVRRHMERLIGARSDAAPVVILRMLRERAPEFVPLDVLAFHAEIAVRHAQDTVLLLRGVIRAEEAIVQRDGQPVSFAIRSREGAPC